MRDRRRERELEMCVREEEWERKIRKREGEVKKDMYMGKRQRIIIEEVGEKYINGERGDTEGKMGAIWRGGVVRGEKERMK